MKKTFKLTLLKSLQVLFSRLFCGRIHFLKDYAGKILLMEDGRYFPIFLIYYAFVGEFIGVPLHLL